MRDFLKLGWVFLFVLVGCCGVALGKSAESGEYAGYFAEPHVVISPSGTRILFGSDWCDSGSVDTYVIDLRAGHE